MGKTSTTVLALVFFAVLATYAKEVVGGEPANIRPLVGGLAVAIMLSAISGPAPKLATAFAFVIFMTAVTNAGPEVIRALTP